jgi:spermidine/putrescine transport system ATP-binding protein
MPARSFWAFGRCAVAHTAISSLTAIGGPGHPCRVVWAIEEDATEVETVTPESAGRGAATDGAVPSVRLANVTKRFRDVIAVDDLSLDIERGEFFTLLGPSGCGKTTTLRMVAGFEEPTEGQIQIDGQDVAGQPPFKRPTNTVFQSYALFPHLSVEENIAFGLRRQGMSKSDARTRVGEELERVGLAREAKRKPRQLSGGQQQRVALARALVNRPAVLLLDEPLGALDLKLRKNLQVELKRIQTEVGITFVYVTHDQEEALTMSDRIAVMNRGVIEQVDIPEVVYDSPTTTFVAGFIGVSNLMPGVAGPVSGGGTKLLLDSGVTVWASEDCGVKEGERCYAVVRPEKLQVSRVEDPAPSDRPSVEGMIESSLYLGTATQMVVRLHDDVTMTVLVPNASEAERQRLPGAGARVRLSWAPDNMHVVKESTTEPEPGVEET